MGNERIANEARVRMVSGGRRIRVLYVSPVGERGGAETVLLNILKFQDASRFEPFVCFLKRGPLVDEVRQLGVRAFVVTTRRLRAVTNTLQAIRDLRRFIKREQIDIVFGNMAMGHVYGGLASLLTPARSVLFQHGIPSQSDPLDWLASCVPADRIYVNSKLSERGQSRFPGAARRTRLLYYGLDAGRFNPSHQVERRLMCQLGVPPESPVVAIVARFEPWKGQEAFLRAASLVRRRLPEARFLLIGDTQFGSCPRFKDRLQELVAELDLTNHVIFTGFRDDVPALLTEVDLVAHPTITPEPFGLAVAEALLMQKAVVASDHGGPAEMITSGVSGVLIPPGDITALADNITALLVDEPRRRALGEKGRLAVLERFSMDRMIRELETSFLECLAR